MLAPRAFGNSGIVIGPLIFGSMRLDAARHSLNEAVNLLRYLAEHGINAWHSSHEYPMHAFFCEALRSAKLDNPVHIMKLGEPHFDTPRFRAERFIGLVEQELRALQTERIGIVQWLLRATPNNDTVRLPLLLDCLEEVEETAQRLKEQGKIGGLAAFPYTPAAAAICLSRASCAGLVSYLNLAETECCPFLDGMEKRGQGFIAIRPLCGGKLLDAALPEGTHFARVCDALSIAPDERIAFALRWPLMHPAVSAVMLSVSSIGHAKQALQAVSQSAADRVAFDACLSRL